MSFILIKDKMDQKPQKEYLEQLARLFGYNISFAYNHKNKNYVNNNYNNFDRFYEDYYHEVEEKDVLILSFSKKNDTAPFAIAKEQKNKSYYYTDDTIIFFEETNELAKNISELEGFDMEKYSELIEMITDPSSIVTLNNNGDINCLGVWFEKDNYRMSSEPKYNVFEIVRNKIRKFLNPVLKNETVTLRNTCLYCGSQKGLMVVNNFATICKKCQDVLNVFECTECKNHFTGCFHLYPNVCNFCYHNNEISTNLLYVMHSVEFSSLMNNNSKKQRIDSINGLSKNEVIDKLHNKETSYRFQCPTIYSMKKGKIFNKLANPT